MENGNATALILPDEQQFRRDMEAINRFQQIVHATMIKDLDYGIIPGTSKPTLLKPGAEKIAKLLGLSDQYEILDRSENWQAPFFRYIVKCRLIHVKTGALISEGLGECNSMEAKYRWRWVSERDLPNIIIEGSARAAEADTKNSKKEPTPLQKLAAVIKETGYSMDEIKSYVIKKYEKESSKDLTPEEIKELTADVRGYQVPRAEGK